MPKDLEGRVNTRFVSSEDRRLIRVGVRGIEPLYLHCQAEEIVHPNAPLEDKPWGFREFAVTDHDGKLVTFFEPPSDYEPQTE